MLGIQIEIYSHNSYEIWNSFLRLLLFAFPCSSSVSSNESNKYIASQCWNNDMEIMTDQTSQETEQRETLQHAMNLFEDKEG